MICGSSASATFAAPRGETGLVQRDLPHAARHGVGCPPSSDSLVQGYERI